MYARFALLGVVLFAAAAVTFVVWPSGSSGPAHALPGTARGFYQDITVTRSDGREFDLPDREVVCSLVTVVGGQEGLYTCPAPYDVEALLAEPQVSVDPMVASSLAIVEIDAATTVSGLPANSWGTVQIYYGATLSSANVLLGEELTGGESGHIENTVWPDTARGVHPTYFYFRGISNGSGYLGTEWLVRGTN